MYTVKCALNPVRVEIYTVHCAAEHWLAPDLALQWAPLVVNIEQCSAHRIDVQFTQSAQCTVYSAQ